MLLTLPSNCAGDFQSDWDLIGEFVRGGSASCKSKLASRLQARQLTKADVDHLVNVINRSISTGFDTDTIVACALVREAELPRAVGIVRHAMQCGRHDLMWALIDAGSKRCDSFVPSILSVMKKHVFDVDILLRRYGTSHAGALRRYAHNSRDIAFSHYIMATITT